MRLAKHQQAVTLAGPYQGVGLIGLGVVLTFALLEAIGMRQQVERSRSGSRSLAFATMVAIGMGLHNLGEGMAIGASFAIGAASLGTVPGGWVHRAERDGRTRHRRPAGGGPPGAHAARDAGGHGTSDPGARIGGYSASIALAVLFLSIGAGAVFQVACRLAANWCGNPMRIPRNACP